MVKTQEIGGRGEVVSDTGGNPAIPVSSEEQVWSLRDSKSLRCQEALTGA